MSLRFRKLDLHVHSPASHDFLDKMVTAEQIIESAKGKGLDAIAITDHNTVDFIDTIKAAAIKLGFTIFPGIEVSCGASQNGSIHVIGLFDPSMNKDDLQKVIGRLEIKGTGEEALTSKSVSDVIDIIRDASGLPVLAHANSSHGALSDIKGNPRKDIVQNPNLCAVEATSGDFNKPEGKRLLDYLNGSDPIYMRHLPVYKSSDNRCVNDSGHCLESIGSGFTYFKMGELTIESLRQCFEDPLTRIIQDYEEEKIHYGHPIVKTMMVTGGFLCNQSFVFHPGMNSIIGGTGTGKSLAIEFLRFVFDLKPDGILFNDHKEKLQKQLCLNSEVKVVFQDRSGEEYEITRKYENQRDPYSSPVFCINKTTGKTYLGNISSIFPLLIYSQNEILEITRDVNAQLKLLDNFRNFEKYRHLSDEISFKLENLDRKLIQAIQDSKDLTSLNKQYKTCEEKIEKLQKKLSSTSASGVPDPFLQLSEARELIQEKIEEYDTLLEKIDNAINDFESDSPTIPTTSKELIDIIEVSLSQRYIAVINSLKQNRELVEKEKKKSIVDLEKWEKTNKYEDIKKAYNTRVNLKKKEEALETERKNLMKDKKALSKKIEIAQKAATQYSNIRQERNKLLAELKSVKDEYFDERSKQATLINEKSGGKLQIVVQSSNDKSVYLGMLNKLKVGSQAEKKEVESIINLITPIDLIENALNGDVKKFAALCKITEIKAENIIKELTCYDNLSESLAMQYKGYPEDLIEINYQKKDGKHYPLPELSMGQKADALIMIALGDGEMPVVIDQPEDALDIPSIWDDICLRLRISKDARQFIFTTHNSSISVSSDSDQFIVLEADGNKGRISQIGSIDEKKIKDDVVGHLEGGYPAYKLKRKKYGL